MVRTETCAYCGKPATTRDHVPPKKLFPRPWPDDLITVPACDTCNNVPSGDDEYLIWVLTLVGTGPEAAKVRQQRLDKTQVTPRRRRMAAHIIDACTPANLVTPAGIYIGKGRAFNVDLLRLNRVLERIVRGLYFVEVRKPVPSHLEVTVMVEPPMILEVQQGINSLVCRNPRSVAQGAFQYWFGPAHDHPEAALCLMRFFGNILALGFVVD